MQKISDAPLQICEKCGGKLQKQVSLSGFQFKGEGWYVTDYSAKKGEKDGKSVKGAKSEKPEKSDNAEKSEKTSTAESTAKSESASNTKSDNSAAAKKD